MIKHSIILIILITSAILFLAPTLTSVNAAIITPQAEKVESKTTVKQLTANQVSKTKDLFGCYGPILAYYDTKGVLHTGCIVDYPVKYKEADFVIADTCSFLMNSILAEKNLSYTKDGKLVSKSTSTSKSSSSSSSDNKNKNVNINKNTNVNKNINTNVNNNTNTNTNPPPSPPTTNNDTTYDPLVFNPDAPPVIYDDRGIPRTAEFIDVNKNGVDDRDEKGFQDYNKNGIDDLLEGEAIPSKDLPDEIPPPEETHENGPGAEYIDLEGNLIRYNDAGVPEVIKTAEELAAAEEETTLPDVGGSSTPVTPEDKHLDTDGNGMIDYYKGEGYRNIFNKGIPFEDLDKYPAKDKSGSPQIFGPEGESAVGAEEFFGYDPHDFGSGMTATALTETDEDANTEEESLCDDGSGNMIPCDEVVVVTTTEEEEEIPPVAAADDGLVTEDSIVEEETEEEEVEETEEEEEQPAEEESEDSDEE